MLEFEEELFDEYGNTSNYHTMRKPQKPRKSSSNEEPLDPSEEAFLKKTTNTTREVLINDAPLSSRKTPKSSPKFFYDELVTKTDSSWNERH